MQVQKKVINSIEMFMETPRVGWENVITIGNTGVKKTESDLIIHKDKLLRE